MDDLKEAFIVLTPGFAASEADTTCLPMQQLLVRKFAELYPTMHLIVLSFQYPYQTIEYKWNGIRVLPFNGKNRGGLQRLLLRKKILAYNN